MSTADFDYEQTVMGIIVNAGLCRSCAMSAIAKAKAGHFTEAANLMKEADEAIRQAHEVQTFLIGQDEGTGKVPVHLIMVHAQDHLMNAMLLKEMAIELIDVHQKLATEKA